MIDAGAPGSPGWWLARCARKLGDPARQARLGLLAAYARGEPPLPWTIAAYREAYAAFLVKSRTNFAELVASAVSDRLQPLGFAVDGDGGLAGRVWEANGLGVELRDALERMCVLGDAYLVVGPPDPDTGVPVVTSEDPRQVVTVHDPVVQRRVRAAAKVFYDADAECSYAYLYTPGRVFVARRGGRMPAAAAAPFSPAAWEWDPDRGGAQGRAVPGMRVPVLRLRNRDGVGEFERHLPLLDRIDYMVCQRLVVATLQAFRQRALVGADTEDEQGRPVDYTDTLVADPGAFWVLPAGVSLWESGQVDLNGILAAARDDVVHLSAVTRTPLYMLTPESANQSAEGASLAREGLVSKAEDRLRRADPVLAEVPRLAAAWAGAPPPGRVEVLWAPVERYTLAERAAASAQAQDVPWAARMATIWQFPPDRVAAMRAERDADTAAAARAQAAAFGVDTG